MSSEVFWVFFPAHEDISDSFSPVCKAVVLWNLGLTFYDLECACVVWASYQFWCFSKCLEQLEKDKKENYLHSYSSVHGKVSS